MHRLLLQASASRLAGLSADDLLWRPHGQPSSVETTLGPRLEGLGPVPPLHADFVRLAALAFFVDRTVPRPRMLRRVLAIEVAVSNPSVWEPHSERLAALLGLLTGDEWNISWRRGREPRLGDLTEPPAGDLCVLFSGGADSTCGVAIAHSEGRRPILVSHFDWRNIGGQQNKALTALETTFLVKPSSVSWRFARIGTQVGSQAEFQNETSRRSRSLLFIALGSAVAAASGNDLWIAENGFTSLNPPLTAESLGALSTRTTHPAFVRGLVEGLRDVGLNVHVKSRFADMTKGQMFSAVATALGDAKRAGELLSATHSCGKPLQDVHREPDAPCGVCLGCLVRRGAFIAAGLRDDTEYIERTLTGAERRAWLSPKRRSVYQALQDRLEVGFEEEDILDLGLPNDFDLDGALQLLRDGLDELAQVQIP
jgi:7-cyano-7-deazaguanine synthase in queuosine biosynthesis